MSSILSWQDKIVYARGFVESLQNHLWIIDLYCTVEWEKTSVTKWMLCMFTFRENPDKIFEVFTEIAAPNEDGSEAFVLQQYPQGYSDEVCCSFHS